MNIFHKLIFAVAALMMMALASCNDDKSYSDMLRDEEHAVNWYLSNNRVELKIPADSEFIIGEDAPYYKMDDDGNVYMKVISKGDMNDRPEMGDKVYFRFMRQNINLLYAGSTALWSGNADDMNSPLGSTSLILGNTSLTSTTRFGKGIQVPLDYLGYDCEVYLVIKSAEGFTTDGSSCIPYVYRIRYFKAIY